MKYIAIILLLALLVAGAAYYVILTPYGPTSETFVEIAPGSSTHAIAIQLARNGIIRTQYAFAAIRTYREFKETSGTLKAGEYRFDHPATPEEIYNRLLRGDVYTKTLTIPEGYNIFDIAQAVETAGFTSRADFLSRRAHQHRPHRRPQPQRRLPRGLPLPRHLSLLPPRHPPPDPHRHDPPLPPGRHPARPPRRTSPTPSSWPR